MASFYSDDISWQNDVCYRDGFSYVSYSGDYKKNAGDVACDIHSL